MFEFMNDIVAHSKASSDGPNLFFPVPHSSVLEAERRLKRAFPDQLRVFFDEIGCGFLKAGMDGSSRARFNHLNRFLDPDEIAGVSLGEDEEITPSEGFEANELPFFEIGDQLYLVIRESRDRPNAVCWSRGDEIAMDLVEFVRRLTIDPRFYHSTANQQGRFPKT